MLTEQQEEKLLRDVKSVTDRLDMVDRVFAAAKLGEDMIMVFQCGHSGLYFDGDYVREWGRKYGIGLGPHPVSECLDSEYDTPVPRITPDVRSIEQIMHPLTNTFAQVDFDLVLRSEFQRKALVCAKDDPYLVERASIIRKKQLVNPRSQLHQFKGLSLTEAMWAQERK